MTARVIWHNVECGHYVADLPLWRSLAAQADGPILELGSGSGRVALDLARRGHRMVALDNDPQLVEVARGRVGDLPVQVVRGDATTMKVGASFALVIAPMQFVQLLDGHSGRSAMFGAAAAALRNDGRLVVTFVDHVEEATLGREAGTHLDVLHVDGDTYTSCPVRVTCPNGRIEIIRRRVIREGNGRRHVSLHKDVLHAVTRERLSSEAALERLSVGRTFGIHGSTLRESVALELRSVPTN